MSGTRPPVRRWQAVIALPGLAAAPCALAHGFDERYDLPVPLSYVVIAACAAVGLSFVAAAVFARPAKPAGPARPPRWGLEVGVPPGVLRATRTAAGLLFVLTIAAALAGSSDPLMNLAPTLVWIVWWLGGVFVAALLCNLWPALDPWRSSFEVLDALARRGGRPAGLALGWRWPAWLGMWPATALLLAWCWLEVVHPLASSPFKLGCAALLWSMVNLAGMVAFGRATWQAHADVFALVFSTLGRMAPLRLRLPGDAPPPVQATAGQVGFVMAMLSTVVFDGLHGGAAWNAFEPLLRAATATAWLDTNGHFLGTLGLVSVWAAFLLAYAATLRISLAMLRPAFPARALAAQLAITLVPIAAAYNVAHNFSGLFIQGQAVLPLLSDPFGWQWDLFGTARWHPDIGLVDAKLTWRVAVAAIVLGHAAAIWWSHRVVLSAGVPPRRAAWGLLPLTLLMLAYTALSLVLIAEPMVLPQGPWPTAARTIGLCSPMVPT